MSAPSSTPRRILILGGGYAGLTLAQRLSKQTNIAITLIDAKADFQERIRLHQVAAGQPLRTYAYSRILLPLGVEFLQARVTQLEPDACQITLTHMADGSQATLPYDYLVYALGSAMDVDAVPGVREHAYAFDSVAAAQGVHAALSAKADARVLVVGGGLTGIETATELAETWPQSHAALAMGQPWQAHAGPGGFAPKAVNYLHKAFKQRGIALHTGARVTQLQAGVAHLSDGQALAFDTCIWTSGFAPPALASAAGLQVTQRGQIVTDAALRSHSHPNIIAIGDAAQAHSEEAGKCRMGCATGLAMATAGARTLRALLAGQEPPAFRFVYLFRNISLGRYDGLIQFVDRRDKPRNLVWTGSAAVAWKEYVCRSTLSTMGIGIPEKPPALPPLRTLLQLRQGMRQYA